MATFSQITNPPDEPTLFASLIARLTGKGLPTTDWGDGEPIPLILKDGFNPLLAVAYGFVADVAKGMSLRLGLVLAQADLATWQADPLQTFLGWLATDNFNLTIRPPTFATWSERFTNANTVAVTIPTGAGVQTATGLIYRYQGAPVTIGPSANTVLPVIADQVGTAYNVAAGDISKLITSIAGVTVTNTAIIGYGGIRESPESVVLRCLGNWGRLQRTNTLVTDAYVALVLDSTVTGTALPTKASVWQHFKDGVGNYANYVTVYLAGDAGPVDGATATAVQNACRPYVAIHDTLICLPSGTAVWSPTVSAYVSSMADIMPATVGILAALATLQRAIPIGGFLGSDGVGRVYANGAPNRSVLGAIGSVPQVTAIESAIVDNVPGKNVLVTLGTGGITVAVGP